MKTPQPDLLETITQVLLEELRAPDGYQLYSFSPTSIKLTHQYMDDLLYIIMWSSVAIIVEHEQKAKIIQYANPRLIELIQQIIDDHINIAEPNE